MSPVVEWMAGEAEKQSYENLSHPLTCKTPSLAAKNAARMGHPSLSDSHVSQNRRDPSTALRAGMGHSHPASAEISEHGLPAHQFPGCKSPAQCEVEAQTALGAMEDPSVEQERRVYRGRTVGMLRRYMRYAIETGRMPSLLGREFFRAKVTKYSVVTFEDRVIFVHDMEMCLEKLDEFSRQIIARHILQEHDCWATARLLDCNEKTVRRLTPLALDLLSDILLEAGLLERIENRTNSCQGGAEIEISVSDCEYAENKF